MKQNLLPNFIRIFLLGLLVIGSTGRAAANEAQKPLPSIQINFNSYSPSAFGNQDVKPTMTIEDGGNTLHLKGNSWKKISLPYTVTPYTVIEFDFKSTAQGEVQGIGFDNDQSISGGYTHKLYGTDAWGFRDPFYGYAPSVPNWKHYRLPVGEDYTGNMLYMVFVNDHDVTNPTGESYFSNIQVYEDPSSTLQSPVNVNFGNYTISEYSNQSPNLDYAVEENGNTLRLTGNGWLKMSLPYTVTSSTIMEFDFMSDSQAELHGIGFDTNNSFEPGYTFQIYGTQSWAIEEIEYDLYAPGWKHFRIPVGKYYTGLMRYVFFGNDHDNVTPPVGQGYFRNLVIHEEEVELPITVNFNDYAVSLYYSPTGSNIPTTSIEDNGNTLHLSGNGWRQISMPVAVQPDTVLSFDFKSTAQGQIHAIGLDTNQNADVDHTFKLYGTQSFGNTDFNNYSASAPGWKHYDIPIGQYVFTRGQQLYLFFGNDHDVASPSAESYFSNIQISSEITSYSYDRVAATNYADTWAHARNNDYPSYGEDGNLVNCGCDDCTNYVSQVLESGGYPLRTGNWDLDSHYEWWHRYNFPPYNSQTWSATELFRSYTGIYNTEFDSNAQFSDIESGDFILLDLRNNEDPSIFSPDGKADHARVVVGYGNISQDEIDYVSYEKQNGLCTQIINPVPPPSITPVLLINQHCIDRKHVAWDYGLESDTQKFYIHVISQ